VYAQAHSVSYPTQYGIRVIAYLGSRVAYGERASVADWYSGVSTGCTAGLIVTCCFTSCQSAATSEMPISCHFWDANQLPFLRCQSAATSEMPISCQFWDCKVLLVTSLTRLASVQNVTITKGSEVTTCKVGSLLELWSNLGQTAFMMPAIVSVTNKTKSSRWWWQFHHLNQWVTAAYVFVCNF